MGRIEEALKKAKTHRQGGSNSAAMSGPRVERNPQQQTVELPRLTVASHVPTGHVVRVDKELLQEQRVIAASENDNRVGPYRQLRTQLLKTMRDNNWRTLAITSANEGAGKSLTAANLSISLARDINTTVLLVDLDLHTPTIHEKLNLNPEKGLVDFLEGRANLEEILFDPGIEQLTVLAGRSAGRQSSELLASPKMQDLIRDLCQQDVANITIFDLPPVLRNDDAILFAPFADATLIVVEDGVTTVDQLQQAMGLLDKANVIGTLLNKAGR